MPPRTVPDHPDVHYYLALFDEHGNERAADDGTLLSDELTQRAADGVTDIFVLSHGWKGDIPAAISQCDRWIGAMARQRAIELHPLVGDRAPLLFVSGSHDNIMPPKVQWSNAAHYRSDKTLTRVVEFSDMPHLLPAAPGWEEIADRALDWALHASASAATVRG